MKWFENNPKRRLLFFVTYLLSALWLLFENIEPIALKVLSIAIALFGAYIALVKSDILKDKFAKNIKNPQFDFLSIFIIIALLVWSIGKFIV